MSYLTYLLGFWTCSPQVKLVFTVSFPSLVITRFPVREYSGPREQHLCRSSFRMHSLHRWRQSPSTWSRAHKALGVDTTINSEIPYDSYDSDGSWLNCSVPCGLYNVVHGWRANVCSHMQSPLAIISSLALDMLWTLCGCGCHVVPCHICQSVKGSQGSPGQSGQSGQSGLLQASCVAPI